MAKPFPTTRCASLCIRRLRHVVRFCGGSKKSAGRRHQVHHPLARQAAAISWLRAAQERHADFLQVTGDALDFALETIIGKSDLRDQLMSLFVTLDPFPEVPNVLKKLKTAGMRTAILSNGSPPMLDAAVKAARLEPLLDAVLSVEEVGVYKPHPKVYQLAVDRLAIPGSAITYMSSNAWDAYAASAFGMQVVWCNRNVANVCRGLLIERFFPWSNCPPSWGQLETDHPAS